MLKRIKTIDGMSIIGYILMLGFLFKPGSLEMGAYGWLPNVLFDIFKIIDVLIIVTMAIDRALCKGVDFIAVCCVIIGISLCISTATSGANPIDCIKLWAPCLCGSLILYIAKSENQLDLSLRAIFLLTSTLSLVNTLSMLLFPEGILNGEHFFWGQRNTSYQIILPSIVTSIIMDVNHGGKERVRLSVRSICIILISIFQVLYSFSATSSIALFFTLFLYSGLWFGKRAIPRLSLWSVPVYGILFFAIVVIRIQNVLAGVSSVLPRDVVTITGRTFIWDKALNILGDGSVLFGCGSTAATSVEYAGVVYLHPHNEILYLMLTGGILLTCLVLISVAFIYVKMYHARDLDSVLICSCGLAGFFVIALTEVVSGTSFYILLTLSYYLAIREDKCDSGR